MVLNVLLVVYASLMIVDITFMLALHFLHDRKGHYLTATLVWVGLFLGFVADGAISQVSGRLHHLFGIPLVTVATYGLSKLTRDIYQLEIPLRKLIYVSISFWGIGVFAHFALSASFFTASAIICVGIVTPILFAAYTLLKTGKNLNFIDRLFGVILIAEGLHILDYPFLRPLDGTAVFGFSLGLLLIYSASMLIPVIINNRIASDQNAALEQKVQERTIQLLDIKQKLVNSAKMSTLGEMAGGVAHEINTPLTTIRSLVDQIKETLDSQPLEAASIKSTIDRIEKTSGRIAKIIKGLRTFARDGSRDPVLPVNLNQLIAETLTLCKERFWNAGVSLTVNEFDPNLTLDGRQIEISQVLLNLLNNAHDAVANLQDKWIKVGVMDSPSWVEIQVTDSGPGIPNEVREKLFQPFFTTKEIGKGTGMGLSISSGIVRAHGGELKLDPQCPNTRFIIRLPKHHVPAAIYSLA